MDIRFLTVFLVTLLLGVGLSASNIADGSPSGTVPIEAWVAVGRCGWQGQIARWHPSPAFRGTS